MSREQELTPVQQLLTMAAQLVELADGLPHNEPVDSGEVAKYITEAKFIAMTGYTKDQLRGHKASGYFTEGVHYIFMPNGKAGWNLEAVTRWQESDQPTQDSPVSSSEVTGTSGSGSGLEVRGCMNDVTFQQRLKVLNKQRRKEGKSIVKVVRG